MEHDISSIAEELRRTNAAARRHTAFDKRALIVIAVGLLAAVILTAASFRPETITIGIGTQNMTTNTVTGGVVLRQLGLLEKNLPRSGRYRGVSYALDWQNATSGPPITNGMMAGNIQIGMMGDFPLLVNGATGQQTGNETRLVAIIAYNAYGGGNGVVVHKDSPYYDLADLKGKRVSVPFGSAAHGMLLRALQLRGLPEDYFTLLSQSPEVGSTNLQEKRIDAHADFVPFAELLPFRGAARKIYDGAETRQPTFHAVVVRKEFADKYPEVVVAYIKSLIEANQWVRDDPRRAAESVQRWTGIEKEVAYMFLGPGGVHTLDPTLKDAWLRALEVDYEILKRVKRIPDLDLSRWVDDRYVRAAYRELGLSYDTQRSSLKNYAPSGVDPLCHVPVAGAREPGQVWVAGGDIATYSSTACTLAAVRAYRAQGKQLAAVYVNDSTLGIKLFADTAFYARANGAMSAFLQRRDAERHAAVSGARIYSFDEVLRAEP